MKPDRLSALRAELIARGQILPPAEKQDGPANDNEFDPIADVWASTAFCFDVIRRRMKAGGPGWEPK